MQAQIDISYLFFKFYFLSTDSINENFFFFLNLKGELQYITRKNNWF